MTDKDPGAQLAQLEAAVSAAEQAERDLDAQARQARTELDAVAAELAALPPDQFDQTGHPKPKSQAARLAGQLDKLKAPPVAWKSAPSTRATRPAAHAPR
jgi:hypothetical protein